MLQLREISRRRLVIFVALVVLLGFAVGIRSRVRINWTDSLPRGLYLVSAIPKEGLIRDEIVVACPPRTYAKIGREHDYLLAGGCPGGVAPVLKHVAALAGDVVRLSAAGISVDGKLLSGTALLTADRRGDSPAHVAFGTYRVAPGQIWLFTHKANGYDSRYFGPVPMKNVLNVARPLLTSG